MRIEPPPSEPSAAPTIPVVTATADPPLEPPEVWCAGVTYERSRDARVDEATVKDVYTMVYDADRPELRQAQDPWEGPLRRRGEVGRVDHVGRESGAP